MSSNLSGRALRSALESVRERYAPPSAGPWVPDVTLETRGPFAAGATIEAMLRDAMSRRDAGPITLERIDDWARERLEILALAPPYFGECGCMGPRHGQPACPCRMQRVVYWEDIPFAVQHHPELDATTMTMLPLSPKTTTYRIRHKLDGFDLVEVQNA